MNLNAVTAQFARVWSALSRLQRISIAAALIAVGGGLAWFTNWHKEKDFRPVFTGMASEDAGAVVAKLKESNVEYRLAENGGTVLVPSSRVAEVRLQMAAAGLPRTGRIGFELFDKTNLGSTDFAEQVNYRRALEGELERSIRAVSEIEQARVHISFARDSVFTESKQPAKASILLTLHQGAELREGNVRAIVHLVSSAVEGLSPEAVSVTDSAGRLLNRPKKTNTADELSEESLEFRRKLEQEMTTKVMTTLEPLLGSGKFRVGMSVDCDFTSGEQSEESYDPDKSVMVTTQKTEETTGTATSGGVPGTASNLPRPAPRSGGTSGGVSRRTENVTYQTSHTVRRTSLPQGSIRRISASVLLDQNVRWELRDGKQNRVLVPPTAESIQTIKEVVAATVGLVPSRGDLLVVQTLPFESTLGTTPPPVPVAAPTAAPQQTGQKFAFPLTDWRVLTGIGAGVLLVVLGAGWVLIKRRRANSKSSVTAVPGQSALAPGSAAASAALPNGAEARPLDGANPSKLLAKAQERVVQTARIESLVEQLRTGIASDPALAASVLRTWIDEGQVSK